MEIDYEIFSWLSGAECVTEYDIKTRLEKKIVLNAEATQLFEIGLKLTPLLSRLQSLRSIRDPETAAPLPGFGTLKESLTPAAKLYNWNVIVKALALYNIEVTEETKNLIVAGDLVILHTLLKRIREAEIALSNQGGGTELPQSKLRTLKNHQPTGLKRTGKQERAKKGAVDIASLDITKELETVENCLEFLLVSLGRNFGLRPKQCAGLLTDSNKYLSHILVKGLKDEFSPVVNWLMEIYSGSMHFSSLIREEEEQNSMNMVFNALKGGFFSKSIEVASWTLKVYSKISYDLISLDMSKQAWEWFISVNGGLDGTLYCLENHLKMEELVLDYYLNVAKFHLNELFTHYLTSVIKNNLYYWRLILSFIHPLSVTFPKKPEEDRKIIEGIIDYWLECACRIADNDGRHSMGERATALNILSEIWLCFPDFVEKKEEVANHVLTMLQRATRDRNLSLQYFALAHCFELFEAFSVKKNRYAPSIYKAITLALVENHHSYPIREFILENLNNVFKKNSTIPVNIVLEPLIKQIQISESVSYFFNIFDFNFFTEISQNPKLTIINYV